MLYELVTFPDIQDFMINSRWNECIFINDAQLPDSSYMVPKDLYDEVYCIKDEVKDILIRCQNFISIASFELGKEFEDVQLESDIEDYLSK